MRTDTRDRITNYIASHGQTRVHDLRGIFHISNVAIHKQLKKLLQEGKLVRVGKPPRVMYQTPGHTTKDIDSIKNKVMPILKEAGITRSSLFGSYVRGEQTEKSDVDILVEYPENMSLFDVVELKDKLEHVLGTPVDLVSYKYIKPRLRQYILPEQVPLF